MNPAGALLGYLLVANLASFALFGWDKSKARRDGQRVSEKTLVVSAVLSGTIGGWLGMSVFRHKTAKPSFQAKMVAASLADLVVVLVAVAAIAAASGSGEA